MTADELDQTMFDKYGLRRTDVLVALKTIPAINPLAADLSADEAPVSRRVRND